MYSKLQSELTASKSIEIFCVHEAGHWIFFKQAGYTEFDFRGPTMVYNPLKERGNERFGYFQAAVRIPEASRIRNYDDSVLDGLARGSASGEVFEEVRLHHLPRPHDGSSDFNSFDEHCRRALRNDFDIRYDAKGRWRRTRLKVKAYLEDGTNGEEVQDAIVKIRYECFRLR